MSNFCYTFLTFSLLADECVVSNSILVSQPLHPISVQSNV